MKQEIQQNRQDQQLATKEMYQQRSLRLIQCLAKIESPDRVEAKAELVGMISDIMPSGKVDIQAIMKSPSIKDLAKNEGKGTMLKALYLLILDFCRSVNVKRNMTDDQMIEAAGMLLDQCGNYRLEDYAAMFTMAKRNQLNVETYQTLDITVISKIEQAYDRHTTELLNRLEDDKYRIERNMRIHESRSNYNVDFPAYWLLANYRVCDKKIYTFKALRKKYEELQAQTDAEKEAEAADYRRRQIEGYARLNNLNIEEVVKQFKKTEK